MIEEEKLRKEQEKLQHQYIKEKKLKNEHVSPQVLKEQEILQRINK